LSSGPFYLSELIASGKQFEGRKTSMIYVEFVLTLCETIKGTMHTNENNKLEMRHRNYSGTPNLVAFLGREFPWTEGGMFRWD
jgi:hypothetical protein